MNERFDINRFWKLVQYEAVNYLPNFLKILLIFASVIAGKWMMSLTVGGSMVSYSREWLVASLFRLSIALSPFIIYKNMNNRKKGYIYAMIPASTLEKLLSMIVLCVVAVPVLSYAVLTCADLLLWLISKVGIGSFTEIDFYNPFIGDLAQITYNGNLLIRPFAAFDNILYLVFIISYSLMLNTIFRNKKILKAVLFNMAALFTIIVLLSFLIEMIPGFGEDFFERLESMSDLELLKRILLIYRCACILLTASFLWITYSRIKKVNY